MPSLRNYRDAISMKPSAFKRLSNVIFDNSLSFSTSHALVLKGEYNGKMWAFKFFFQSDRISERHNRLKEMNLRFIPQMLLWEDEVKTVEHGTFVSQPVLMSEWINGVTLAEEMKRLCQNNDRESLMLLKNKVLELFVELLSLDIVHGDLKPENILVSADGRLYIIDWDSYYAPLLKDFPTNEIGTCNFQHPKRTVSDYGRRVDDYSIALIALTLIAYSEQPNLFGSQFREDATLFLPELLVCGDTKNRIHKEICEAWHYFPLRRELLRFISGDSFEYPGLRAILVRMLGKAKFNSEEEELIDKNLPIRRIVNKKTMLYGYINEDENVIIDTMYGDCTTFADGLCGVRINHEWFFIDRTGTQLSDTFQKITDCSGGKFPVKIEKEWRFFCSKERKLL